MLVEWENHEVSSHSTFMDKLAERVTWKCCQKWPQPNLNVDTMKFSCYFTRSLQDAEVYICLFVCFFKDSWTSGSCWCFGHVLMFWLEKSSKLSELHMKMCFWAIWRIFIHLVLTAGQSCLGWQGVEPITVVIMRKAGIHTWEVTSPSHKYERYLIIKSRKLTLKKCFACQWR